jgi:hypothetical protein
MEMYTNSTEHCVTILTAKNSQYGYLNYNVYPVCAGYNEV